MNGKLFERAALISLEYLVPFRKGMDLADNIRMYGPPMDDQCEVCKRHISELEPFPGGSYELNGEDLGAPILVERRRRRVEAYDESDEKVLKEAEKEAEKEVVGPNDVLPWLISKFGEVEGERLYSSGYLTSWECRDCIGLEQAEYLEAKAKQPPKRGRRKK
jgi:hypothetical protein